MGEARGAGDGREIRVRAESLDSRRFTVDIGGDIEDFEYVVAALVSQVGENVRVR